MSFPTMLNAPSGSSELMRMEIAHHSNDGSTPCTQKARPRSPRRPLSYGSMEISRDSRPILQVEIAQNGSHTHCQEESTTREVVISTNW